MHASAERGSKPCVASHHQRQAPSVADAGEVTAECSAVRVSVVPQHDTSEAAWQS
jgi:hypothetical protein